MHISFRELMSEREAFSVNLSLHDVGLILKCLHFVWAFWIDAENDQFSVAEGHCVAENNTFQQQEAQLTHQRALFATCLTDQFI